MRVARPTRVHSQRGARRGKARVAAFAGDMEAAHLEGCGVVSRAGSVNALPADIVVTSNGGYRST
jgi:nickel-dependent lactate racemase